MLTTSLNLKSAYSKGMLLDRATVKPAMKRSRNRLYMKAMGRLPIRQAGHQRSQ